MSNHNPYSKAADAYGTTAAATDQRALEGKILLKAAQKLEDLAKRLSGPDKVSREEIDEALLYNQKLWQLFAEDMMNDDHLLPQEIKNNIASLAVFVFKRSREILIETSPEKFKALININRNIAAGLMKRPAPAPAAHAAAAPASPEAAATDSMA